VVKDWPLGLVIWDEKWEPDADGELVQRWYVVDGQQRLQAILEYMQGEAEWTRPSVSPTSYPFVRFTERTDAARLKIRRYQVPVAFLHNFPDQEVRKLFLRVQFGMALTAGEKIKSISSAYTQAFYELTEQPIFQNTEWSTRYQNRELHYMLAACALQSTLLKNPFQRFEYKNISAFLESSNPHTSGQIQTGLRIAKQTMAMCKSIIDIAVDSSPVVQKTAKSSQKLYKLLFASILRLKQHDFRITGLEPDMATGLKEFINKAEAEQILGQESAEYTAWRNLQRSGRMDTDDVQLVTGILTSYLVNSANLEPPQSEQPRFFSRSQREEILARARGRCQCEECELHSVGNPCRATLMRVNFHADHITPWIDRGPTTLENAQALCAGCNLRKGATNIFVTS
jgi:hypothetical protein